MRRTAVLTTLAVAVGVLWVSTPASACTLVTPDPTEEELLAQAELVFEGVAVSSRDPNAGSSMISTGGPIFWTFAVDRQIKGSADAEQEVGTPRDGATCGFGFTARVRYRVFARNQGGSLMTFLGSGNREAPLTAPTTVPPPAPPTERPPIPRTG